MEWTHSGVYERASGITAMREKLPHSRVLYIPCSSIHRLRICIPPIADEGYFFSPSCVFFWPNNNLFLSSLGFCRGVSCGVDTQPTTASKGCSLICEGARVSIEREDQLYSPYLFKLAPEELRNSRKNRKIEDKLLASRRVHISTSGHRSPVLPLSCLELCCKQGLYLSILFKSTAWRKTCLIERS